MAERNYTVDAFRLLGALSVVALHVPYGDMANPVVLGVRMWGRWAVPFFFLLSGYFFEKNYAKNGDRQFVRTILNILTIVFITNLFYIIFNFLVLNNIYTEIFTFRNFLNGCYGHLWFLHSMLMGYVIFIYMKHKLSPKNIIVVSVVIYMIVLFFDAYSKLLNLSLEHDLVRMFVSIPFIATGYLFSFYKVFDKDRRWLYLVLIVVGFITQALEIILLYKKSGYGPHNQEFVFGSAVFGIGMFGLAFTVKTYRNNVIAKLGERYSLLIYLYHPIIIYVLFSVLNIDSIEHGYIHLLNPVLCFLGCMTVFLVLNRIYPKLINFLNGG